MRLAFLIVAIVIFIIAALLDFGTISANEPHVLGWLGLGLGSFAAAHLPLPPP